MSGSAFARTFCKVVLLATADSHGMLAENMPGGSSVPPQLQCLPPSPSFMCPVLPVTVSTESRRPGARLPGLTCCLAICVPGSLLHVGLLPGSCLTVLLADSMSFSQSPSGMSV